MRLEARLSYALLGLVQATGSAGGLDLLRFGVIFEDKTAYVPFIFLCRVDILCSTHHGNCTTSEQKMNTFSV